MPNYQTSSLQEKVLIVHRELRMKNWTPQLVQVAYTAGKVRQSNWKKLSAGTESYLEIYNLLQKCRFTT
jgi:hypothetical protein